MCGRFATFASVEDLISEFGIDKVLSEFRSSYNIAPTQEVPVILSLDNKLVLDAFRWGLIPHWAIDGKTAYSMINARAESIVDKPSYRKAMEKRRCIIPANGFYEWKKEKDGKTPFFIQIKDRKMFGLAGIYEEWKSDEKTINSFAIVTTAANEFMKGIHDRMPVILEKMNHEAWLDNSRQALDLLKQYPASKMTAYEVSTYVNSPRNNSEICIKEV